MFGFHFLGCYAATQPSTQIRQRCIQAVCSNKGSPEAPDRIERHSRNEPLTHECCFEAILFLCYVLFDDCCFEVDVRIRRYTNKRYTKENTRARDQIYFEL